MQLSKMDSINRGFILVDESGDLVYPNTKIGRSTQMRGSALLMQRCDSLFGSMGRI